MKATYDAEQKKLLDLQREAERGGDAKLYDHLVDEVETRADYWPELQEREELSYAEHTKLIQSKEETLAAIRRLKEERHPPTEMTFRARYDPEPTKDYPLHGPKTPEQLATEFECIESELSMRLPEEARVTVELSAETPDQCLVRVIAPVSEDDIVNTLVATLKSFGFCGEKLSPDR